MVKYFYKLLDFYLDASIHVALAITALCYLTAIDLTIAVDGHLAGFIFFSSIICYNFVKYGVEARKYLIVNKPYHKAIQVFSFLCAPMASYFFFRLNSALWLPIVLLTLLSALYALPFLPKSKNLRSLGGFKIFLVAFIWSGFTVLLPCLDVQLQWGAKLWFLFFERFFLVLLLFIPFEIRDLSYDSPELKTIPQRFGIIATKLLGYAGIGVLVVLKLLGKGATANTLFEMMLTVAVLAYAIYMAQIKQSRYFASFWVEAIPVFLLVVAYAFKN